MFLRERCDGSEHTAASYRSNLRRLAWFSAHIGLQSLRQFERDHWPDFAEYLGHPPTEHIMARSVGYNEEGWRPFRGPLAGSSVKLSQIIAKAFFEWLSDPSIGAMEINPVATVRSKKSRRSATVDAVERFLPADVMPFVEQGIEQMYPAEDGNDEGPAHLKSAERQRMVARARWVMKLGLLTGLRASEIARADTSMIKAGSTRGSYSLHITRKGNVQAKLPLMPDVIEEFERYLRAYGLTWQRGIALPLVLPARLGTAAVVGNELMLKPASRGQIWRIVKGAMRSAADVATASGDPGAAERLQAASTHWLRHTFATTLTDAGVDVRSVRDLLDHADLRTSSRYTHSVEGQLRADLATLSTHLKTAREVGSPD